MRVYIKIESINSKISIFLHFDDIKSIFLLTLIVKVFLNYKLNFNIINEIKPLEITTRNSLYRNKLYINIRSLRK